MKKKAVVIEWVDAEGDSGWVEDDPDKEPRVLKTVGLLVRKNKSVVVHASTYDPESGHWSELGKIPTGMVKSITVIGIVDV